MSSESKKNLGFIQLPNDASLIPALLRYAQQIVESNGFSVQASQRIQLALEEACSDVIQTSFGPDDEGEFDVSFLLRRDGIEIHIHDMGLPVDPNMNPVYDPKKESLDGLGAFLISHMVDSYQFNNLGKLGKETVLIKYFDTQNVGEDAPEPKGQEAAPLPKKDEVIQVNFNLRRMKDEEALDVCRCIYDCYGYSYANENVYYPERMIAMNEEGKLLSVVAVTDDGEVGGHFAIINYDHLPPEAGIAVTKKKFRGQGFARQLGEKLSEAAAESGVRGLQVKEVTAHPYTQKFCAKLGYSDCGILLAHSPKTLSFKGIADKLKQRNSDILGFKYLIEPDPISIYVPQRHDAMVCKLFENIGVKTICLDLPVAPKAAYEQTVMNVTVHSARALAEIAVIECGPDALPILRKELRKLFMDEIQVIEFYLSLDDPAAVALVPDLEKMGFMFTGVLPETGIGNALVMQCFNGVHIDYDELVIVSDVAKELVAYLREIYETDI
jgi:serine/threonine-protein kinase RsbW